MLFIFLSMFFAFADEPDKTIVVEAHKDFEVYVAPIVINNATKDIEAVVDPNTVFGYASQHSRNAKVLNKNGSYDPIDLNSDGFKVFNKETIEYAWDNCDYERLPKKCSYNNNHYLLETTITVGNHQLVVNMLLYDPELQVVAKGSYSSNKTIKWIKQQEISSVHQRTTGSSQQNCGQGVCSRPNGIGYSDQTISVNKPKEELPLKFEIPHFLLDKHIYQASLALWVSTKIK